LGVPACARPRDADLRKQALAPLLAVVAALCLAPAVRADIVDFDPTQDTVPQILEPDELALVQQAMSADIVYMLSDVSPGGRYVMAYGGSGYGFLDLVSPT
jgi:hypothetical protein